MSSVRYVLSSLRRTRCLAFGIRTLIGGWSLVGPHQRGADSAGVSDETQAGGRVRALPPGSTPRSRSRLTLTLPRKHLKNLLNGRAWSLWVQLPDRFRPYLPQRPGVAA